MTITERICENVQRLPESLQAEALDFVEYLLSRVQRATSPDGDEVDWTALSLGAAMRGLEDEDTPGYTRADLKERFS